MTFFRHFPATFTCFFFTMLMTVHFFTAFFFVITV